MVSYPHCFLLTLSLLSHHSLSTLLETTWTGAVSNGILYTALNKIRSVNHFGSAAFPYFDDHIVFYITTVVALLVTTSVAQ